MLLKDYQEEALRYVWSLEEGEGASSRQVWNAVNERLPAGSSISRASIINFLNSMVEEGVLTYTETTGKGGHRRIYSAKLDEEGFKKYIAETVLENMMRDWPEETKEVINEFK
ncbi:MAG: BlaI/MecI/CopY family transcriptional regulator [Candidatus Bathyarchaeia archaeon]